MTPAQLAALRQRRASVRAQMDALRAAVPDDDGSKAAKRRMSDWAFEMQSIERVAMQLDRAIAAAEREGGTPDDAGSFHRTRWAERGEMIASIPKGSRKELRVALNEWRGRATLDVRLWHLPEAGGEWKPSGKGVSIGADDIDALVAALGAARDAVAARPARQPAGKRPKPKSDGGSHG